MRLTKELKAFFAFAESLPTSATLDRGDNFKKIYITVVLDMRSCYSFIINITNKCLGWKRGLLLKRNLDTFWQLILKHLLHFIHDDLRVYY